MEALLPENNKPGPPRIVILGNKYWEQILNKYWTPNKYWTTTNQHFADKQSLEKPILNLFGLVQKIWGQSIVPE